MTIFFKSLTEIANFTHSRQHRREIRKIPQTNLLQMRDPFASYEFIKCGIISVRTEPQQVMLSIMAGAVYRIVDNNILLVNQNRAVALRCN